ncbi:MAG: hypothetical protein FVQ81_04865 [Candidatus Glassbacteria bacterium]|nr:hypothetical protein [Candidatus Glassbacteria bacterium]
METLITRLDFCAAEEIPWVVNLHPIHVIRGELDLFGLKEKLADEARARGIPVMTLGEPAGRITRKRD